VQTVQTVLTLHHAKALRTTRLQMGCGMLALLRLPKDYKVEYSTEWTYSAKLTVEIAAEDSALGVPVVDIWLAMVNVLRVRAVMDRLGRLWRGAPFFR